MTAAHDLFLSYRHADATAMQPLLDALHARGVRVWRDAREVEDFGSIQQAVNTGLAGARALLAWYSRHYNASRACQWELTSAYLAGEAEGDARQRVLVLNPEPNASHIHLPKLFDQLHMEVPDLLAHPELSDGLAQRIQATLAGLPAAPLGALHALQPPRWWPSMGTGSPRFVGRLREMWALHGLLQQDQAAMLTGSSGRPGRAMVRGSGGIGKSLMAEEYALRFGAAYPGGVFWLRAYGHPDGGTELNAEQRDKLRESQWRQCCDRLGLETSGLNAEQVLGVLERHFAAQGLPFLWVVDDLPPEPGPQGIAAWQAPHALGRTLFTSRSRRFSQIPALELPQLAPDEARRLLARGRELNDADGATADAICALLGYHALAVDVCAPLVARRGVAGVLQALQTPDRDALALAAALDEALPNGHQREIAATLLAGLRLLDPGGLAVLQQATVLAAAPIPVDLLLGCVQADDDAAAQDALDLALHQLLGASLADEASPGTVLVHTLVSRSLRFAGPGVDWPQLRRRAINALTPPMRQAGDVRQHGALADWTPHARILTETVDNAESADLRGLLARLDYERGAYAMARDGYEAERGWLVDERGEEHPDTLTSINNLASTIKAQGDLSAARLLQKRVLKARQRVLGEEHLSTLTSMNNLASTLRQQRKLAGARLLQERSLAAYQRLLGEEHPDTLMSMNNLANTLWDQGDLANAMALQERALAGYQQLPGEEHPDMLKSMGNLASKLLMQGNLSRAMALQERVLAAHQSVPGEEHPDTLTSMNNLAHTLWQIGERPRAVALMSRAVRGSERVLGPAHPDTDYRVRALAIMRGPQVREEAPGGPATRSSLVARLAAWWRR